MVSLAAALASLIPDSAPSYDPWSWIVWGREVLHLHLVTVGGPTWKPLPVLFTTVFAGFGAAAPDLWLAVARAGGILGLGLAAVLASRLARTCSPSTAGSAVAAALAATGLLLLSGYLDSVASGESEGLLVAAVTLAILRHLDGARRQALALGFAAALIRPESWPFLCLYGVYLWRRDPSARKLIASLLALVPALWFGPELWGAHSLLRGVQWAQHPRPGSPAFASCPFCAELTGHAWPLLIAPFKLGVALSLGLAALSDRAPAPSARARGRAAVTAIAALGLAWIAEEAALTQTGFSGSDRYLIAPVALLIVLGAAGWGAALQTVLAGHRRVGTAALAALLIASTIAASGELASVTVTGARQRAGGQLRAEMRAAVEAAGGARRLIACGSVQTNPSEAPLAAWTLGVQLLAAESGRGNVVIQSRDASSPVLAPAVSGGHRLIARAGGVRIYAHCAG